MRQHSSPTILTSDISLRILGYSMRPSERIYYLLFRVFLFLICHPEVRRICPRKKNTKQILHKFRMTKKKPSKIYKHNLNKNSTMPSVSLTVTSYSISNTDSILRSENDEYDSQVVRSRDSLLPRYFSKILRSSSSMSPPLLSTHSQKRQSLLLSMSSSEIGPSSSSLIGSRLYARRMRSSY